MLRLSIKWSYAVIYRLLYSFFFFLYLEIAFWQCFGIFSAYLKEFVLLLSSIGCFLFAFLNSKFLYVPKKCINYGIIIIGIGVLMQLINGRAFSGITMSAISAVLLAFVFFEKRIYIFFLYLHIVIITLVVGYKYFSGADFNVMFVGTSRNTISIFFMFGVIALNLEELKRERAITLLPSILFLIFAVAAAGRSGTICALLYFIAVCREKFLSMSKRYFYFVVSSSVIFLLMIWSFYGQVIVNYISNLEVFMRISGTASSGNQRSLMNETYVSNIDFLTFFFGYDFSTDIIFLNYHLNPHNSFITLHHLYGIWGFLFILIIIYIIFKLRKTINGFYSISLIIILLRAFTDQMMFPGEYDFIILYFVLLYSDHTPLTANIKRVRCYPTNSSRII